MLVDKLFRAGLSSTSKTFLDIFSKNQQRSKLMQMDTVHLTKTQPKIIFLGIFRKVKKFVLTPRRNVFLLDCSYIFHVFHYFFDLAKEKLSRFRKINLKPIIFENLDL